MKINTDARNLFPFRFDDFVWAGMKLKLLLRSDALALEQFEVQETISAP